jgi:hypothetical protein
MENVPELPEENENRDNTEAEKMNGKIMVAILLLVFLAGGVQAADHYQDFQKYWADGGWTFTGTATISPDDAATYPELITLKLPAAGDTAGWNSPQAGNYFAMNCPRTVVAGSNPKLYFYDASYTLLASQSFGCTADGVLEWRRRSTDGKWWMGVNGANTYSSTMAVAPSYIRIEGSLVDAGGDMVHFGDTGTKYFMSTIPPNWSVIRDPITPANSGLYACYPNGTCPGTFIRSTYMYSRWSQGNTSETGAMPIAGATILKSIVNGLTYETLGRGSGFTGITRNNLSVLTGSSAPSGMYSLSLANGSGSNNLAYFWLLGYGYTLTLDDDIYSLDDTATVTYSNTGGAAYWDTATYDYSIVLIDIYGTELDTQSISAESGTVSFTLDSDTFEDTPIVYAALKRVHKTTSEVYYLAYDEADLYTYIGITGYVNNAVTALPLQYANVSVLSGGVWYYGNSSTTGEYNVSGFNIDTELMINGTLAGYTTESHRWTPLKTKEYTVNISLVPNPLPPLTVTIAGLALEVPYYNPRKGVTVYNINQTTHTFDTYTSNNAGYFVFTGLQNNAAYDLSGTDGIWSSYNPANKTVISYGV